MTEFSVFMPLQGMAPKNGWLGRVSLKNCKTDHGLDDLWTRENQDSSEFTRYDRSFGTRSRIGRVCTDIKIAGNTKINHIIVFFTDLYNAIFIDRFPSETKIGKDSWYFNNSLLWNPELSSTSKSFLFLLETQKKTTIQQVNSGKTINVVFKKMLELFLKILKKIDFFFMKIELQYSKEDCKKVTQKGKLQTTN